MKFRHILSFVLSLLLMFSILILQLCIFTKTVILNEGFYKDRLNKVAYFSSLKEDLDSSLKNLSIATAIPEDIFSDYTGMTYLKESTYINIINTIKYMDFQESNTQAYIDIRSLEAKLNKYLDDYADKNKLVINADMRNQMTVIAQEAGTIITNHIQLFNIEAISKYSEFQSFRKAISLASEKVTIVIGLIAIILIMLTLVNIRCIWKVLLWTGSCLIPAAFVVLIPSFMALIYSLPYRISISDGYLNEALKIFSLGFIYYFIKVGIIYFAVGIVMLIMYSFISRKIDDTNT